MSSLVPAEKGVQNGLKTDPFPFLLCKDQGFFFWGKDDRF